MASGRRHWQARLRRLQVAPSVSRAGRRQLRKLLGRRMGLEWRGFGHQSRGIPPDALNAAIMGRAQQGQHLAQALRAKSKGSV